MIFDDIVKDAVENTSGALAALLMGSDGISLSKYVPKGSGIEMEVIGIEYANLLAEVRKAADVLESGEVKEGCITTEKFVVIMRSITKEYFMAMAIAPGGNIGKGRFLLRVAAPKVGKELQ